MGLSNHVDAVCFSVRVYILTVAPGPAKEFFDKFCDRVRAAHSREKVAEGVFGAYMEVSLVRGLYLCGGCVSIGTLVMSSSQLTD